MSCIALSSRGVDKLIHEPVRFAIMRILYSAQDADFVYMQREIGINQGKLSSDLARLREAGYIEITKTYKGKIPITICQVTIRGTIAFENYVDWLKQKLANAPEFGAQGHLRSRHRAASRSRHVQETHDEHASAGSNR